MAIPPDHSPTAAARVSTGSRSSLSFVLSGVMLTIYAAFVLLVAYHKPFMGSLAVPGVSWGILLGAAVIVAAWILTLIYVLAANRKGGV